MRKSYFAAANTENGFVSLFDKIFSPLYLAHLYIIKGGPGTGKSTFMHGIAAAAEQRGLDVEYYYCSADTGSLDGIKIPLLGVAVIDGTAPHTVDPKYPGACETIINLGEYFDTPRLKDNKEDIVALTDRCSAFYAAAKRFLHAAGEVERARLETAVKAFDSDKAKRAAVRAVSRACFEKGVICEKYISAIGTHGKVHLDTAQRCAERTVHIVGKYGFPQLFMEVLSQTVIETGAAAERFPTVLSPMWTEALLVGGILFIVSDDEEQRKENTLNAMRFVKNEELSLIRGKLRFAEKCEDSLLDGALEALSFMGRAHDELESYYISAMDFAGEQSLMQKVSEEILSRGEI